jgi:hypothetical protein
MATKGPFDEEVVVGTSEYGGDAGLVQPAGKGHHPTPSERLGMVNRLLASPSVLGGSDHNVDPATGVAQPVGE